MEGAPDSLSLGMPCLSPFPWCALPRRLIFRPSRMMSNEPNEKAPRVLLVCGAFSPEACGVGDYTRRLALELAAQGADVHVLTSTRAGRERGIRIHAVVEEWTRTAQVKVRLERVLDAVKPDVVQIQYPGSYGHANRAVAGNLLPQWVRSRGFKVVTTLHEWGERSLRWRLRAGFMSWRSHAVVAVTSHDAARLASLPMFARRNVRHIAIGANLEFDRSPAPRSPDPVFAFFGFLHPLKGLEELLDAASLLRPLLPHFRLDLHGHYHPDSDRHHAAIRDQVRRLDLVDSVRFPGPVPSDAEGASRAFQEAWLGVLPFREGVSERRGSFLALGRSGLPVLTSPGPWQPDWLRDGENSFLEPLVPSRWASRLAQLSARPERLEEVGERLKAEIVERHSWGAIASRHRAFWKELA